MILDRHAELAGRCGQMLMHQPGHSSSGVYTSASWLQEQLAARLHMVAQCSACQDVYAMALQSTPVVRL